MSEGASVTNWIRRLKNGDDEAARELWQRYFARLVQHARRRLGDSPRRVADEEDVALSVFRCLCEGATQGRFADLADRLELWRLLVAMTTQKVIDQTRMANQQKRGGGKVRGDSVLGKDGQAEDAAGFDHFAGTQPSPELLCMVAEEDERLMQMLADDQMRQIAAWKLEGYNNGEIAERLKVTRRTVERELQSIRRTWSPMGGLDDVEGQSADREAQPAHAESVSDVADEAVVVGLKDPDAADELLPLVYDELRKLAAAKLSREKPGQTLQPTALVHEAYLRLAGSNEKQQFNSRSHFFAAAAEAMRRILVEQARRKGRQKRGSDRRKRRLEVCQPQVKGLDTNVLAVDEALSKLAVEHPEKAQLVKLRYFGGLTLAEAAEALQISGSTADRHWKYARAWLARELRS